MEKVKVFISYAHEDTEIIQSIVGRLEQEEDIVVSYDKSLRHGRKLHDEISSLINKSDVVVALITKEWLLSNECRDELIRAHERRKTIIAMIRMDGDTESFKLPHFISDDRQIRYQKREFTTKLEELSEAIKSEGVLIWQQTLYRYLRILGDKTQSVEDAFVYQKKYVTQLLRDTLKEVEHMLTSKSFEIELGLEKNFLSRAKPIFQNSQEIYALSIADISNFWTDSKNIQRAQDYIECQREKKVLRLFVFSSPEQLNDYKNILQANYDSYGKKRGGVFLMSKKTYYSYIYSITQEDQFIKNIFEEDFGVLIFDNGNYKEHLLAILNEYSLKFKPYNPESVTSASLNQYVDKMESLNLINEGEFSTEHNILRWCDDLYENIELFENATSTLFSDHENEIFHIVLIRSNDKHEEIEKVLFDLQHKFYLEKEELKINDAWVQKVEEVLAHDGNFGGLISIGHPEYGKFDFMFCVLFESKDALKHYYQHPVHSQEREILYRSINPDVNDLYEEARSLRKNKGVASEDIVDVYHKIEKTMSPFIFRYDSSLNDPIEKIIMRNGIPISNYKR